MTESFFHQHNYFVLNSLVEIRGQELYPAVDKKKLHFFPWIQINKVFFYEKGSVILLLGEKNKKIGYFER